jgi:hypothetical protein
VVRVGLDPTYTVVCAQSVCHLALRSFLL